MLSLGKGGNDMTKRKNNEIILLSTFIIGNFHVADGWKDKCKC